MSLWDELRDLGEDVLRGDWRGVAGDLGLGPGHSQSGQTGQIGVLPIHFPTVTAPSYGSIGGMNLGGVQGSGLNIGPGVVGSIPAGFGPRQPGDKLDKGAEAKCCNRFTFNDDVLVDGVTGRAWLLDKATKSLDEIPLKNDNAKQKLFESMVETKLSSIRARYEVEQLTLVPKASRAAALARFEKDHLDPIREAAQAGSY